MTATAYDAILDRDRAADPRSREDRRERAWRLAPLLLGAFAAVLYLLDLTISGYANTYYALAAQAGSQSWSALFFGALDSSGFITIDKPPLATWIMSLSVKAFGLSSWSILVPEALLGVATVVLLYATVARSFGRPAGVIAGIVMALTPVAVLIFRYDNPDALLVFLLVAAAAAVARGLEDGRIRWAVLAGVLVGAGFLTKYLQAWMVLPGFALVWLTLAPGGVRRRLVGVVAAGLGVAISSGWWVAVVELIPAFSRPYIGGSTTNSALELLLGYDGLGRIFGGRDTGLGSALDGLGSAVVPGAGGRGGPTFGGDPGLLRMFNDQFGGQIAWLLGAALLFLVIGIALHARSGRLDRRLAGYAIWGSWLVVHVLVFSLMSGIIHPYYTVVLAPAIAALVGAGVVDLWRRRATTTWAGALLAAAVVLSSATAVILLGRTSDFAPGLGYAALGLGLGMALVIALPGALVDERISRGALALAAVAVMAGPLAYDVQTIGSAHAGGDPAAGPVSLTAFGPGPGIGGPGGSGAGVGDLGLTSDRALVDYLLENRGDARWIVAVNGSQQAAAIQLEAQAPVMSMGGFTGGDPTPTLDQLKAYVAAGELRFVLAGGPGGSGPGGLGPGVPGGRSNGTDQASRSAWLATACAVVTVPGSSSGATLYDCGASAAL